MFLSPINYNYSKSYAVKLLRQPAFGTICKLTSEELRPERGQEKFFIGNDHILAKYVPQGHFSIAKYDGTEATRYMKTGWCGPCSKFLMYDPEQKAGFLCHTDSPRKLSNSSGVIAKKLEENNIDPKSVQVRLIGGEQECKKNTRDAYQQCLKELGIQKSQIVEENLVGYGKRPNGIILDLKTGQTYNYKANQYYQADLDEHKNELTPDEFLKSKREMEKMKMIAGRGVFGADIFIYMS